MTLTVSHQVEDSAADVLGLLTRAKAIFSRRMSSKGWVDRKGAVDVIEQTYGAAGWHFHVHSMLFTGSPLDGEAVQRMQSAWAQAVAECGGTAQAGDVGCRVDLIKQAPSGAPAEMVAAYIAKMEGLSWEVAGEVHKRSRKGSLTLADLVALAETDAGARGLVVESLQALQNKHRIHTGKIAALLGVVPLADWEEPDAPDQTDDSRAVQPVSLAKISIEDLRMIAARHSRCDLALVRLAIRHGQAGVDRAVAWVRRRAGRDPSEDVVTRARISDLLARATAGPLRERRDIDDYIRLIDAPRRARKGIFAARVGVGARRAGWSARHYAELGQMADAIFAVMP